MTATAKAHLRLREFVGERLAGAPAGLLPGPGPAQTRRQLLEEFRRRASEASHPPRRRAGSALGPAAPPSPNWVPIGPYAVRKGQAATLPVVAGRVPDLTVSIDGRRVYAATSNGGIWRSTDSGRSWEPMSDEFDLDPVRQQVDTLAHGAIALVDRGSAAQDLLYVGTGEGHTLQPATPSFFGVGMLRSTDGGAHWTQEASNPDLTGRAVFALAVDPADDTHLVAATNAGVYRRQAGATPWQTEALPAPVVAGTPVTSVVVGNQGGAAVFFAATRGGRVFSSTAVGAWTALPALPAPAIDRVTLACSTTDPPVLYALASNAAGNTLHGVHRLAPGAAAWSGVTGVPAGLLGDQGWYDQAIAVDPNDPNLVYVGGSTVSVGGEYSASLYRCALTASGPGFAATSTVIGGSVHADVHALTFRPGSSTELWVGCDGGVFATSNARLSGDRVFEARNTGLSNLSLMGLGHHPQEEAYGFCGAQDCGGLRYLGSEVWDHQLPGDGGDTVVHWDRPTRLLNIYLGETVRRADVDGARYASSDVSLSLAGESRFFYPPMVGTPAGGSPSDADIVAFGAERPWVSTGFGGGWSALPARVGAAGTRVRSLAFASATRLWAGWEDGHVARYDLGAGGWGRTDLAPPGEGRPVTCIAVDPADATGDSVYVTLGGALGGGPRVRRRTGGAWAAAAGTPAEPLLDVQHNAIVVDPSNHQHLYAGADIGVWRSVDAGGTWQPFSANLPDAAVLDLDLLPAARLLRATTHGRGVFEVPLDGPQPGVELVLRANPLDQRRRPARADVTLPGDRNRRTRLDESPDIYVDAPDRDGRYRVDPVRAPDLVELVESVTGDRVLASIPEAPAVTRVHVVVHNRGVTRADAVRVALLVGPEGAALPAGYADAARTGAAIDAGGWKSAGSRTVDGLRAGRPAVVTFDLRSDLLPPADQADGQHFMLLALLHHGADEFPAGAPTGPTALVTSERRAAMRRVTAARAEGRAAGGVAGAGARAGRPGGTGLLVPVTAALLAHHRLGDIVDQLERKVKSRRVSPAWAAFTTDVRVHPVERRVLALARSGLAALRAGPTAPVPRQLPGSGIGSYALLGALGFEIPSYASVLAPGGTWVADTLRRGTADPHRSLVKVPASELPLAVGRLGVAATTGVAQEAARGFTSGMLAAAAAGILVAPQLADLHAQDTNADWSRHAPSTGAAALERQLRRRFLGGDARASTLGAWLPPAADVPAELWDGYVRAIGEVYRLPQQRVPGFPAFEQDFEAGDWLTGARLRGAYGLLLDDLRTSSWPWPAWWGLISPILLGPSVSMLVGQALPHAKAFFTEGAQVDERAVFELLTLSMGIGSLAPFVYSMILWSAVDGHTEAFVTALVLFIARAALVIAALASSGDEEQEALTRWLAMFLPLAGTDVYAFIRAAAAGSNRPGVSTVFGLQTVPALTGLATLGVSGLLKGLGLSHGWPFWLSWGLHTAGMLFGVGIPVAVALADGGGWRSWFLRSDRHLPLLSSLAATGAVPPEPLARARVFDTSTLWADPAVATPDLPDLAYPSGMRPLVRLWWEGDGELTARHDGDTVTLRHTGGEVVVRLPAGATAASLATRLASALAGVKAEPFAANDLAVALPWPGSLADPGDAGPRADAVSARARFVPVGRSKASARVLRHAPRADLSTPAGLVPDAGDPFPVLPSSALGDLEAAGLGAAADLAALLATAAAPTLGTVTVADGLQVLPDPRLGEVVQVFRRWNLDERRLEEWRTLVTGGAPVEPPPAGVADPLVRTPPGGYPGPQPVGSELVAAMGWLPLWRAWLRVATDPAADADAPFAAPSTPLVRFGDGSVRRPTNAQLTEGVRYLLDLGAA